MSATGSVRVERRGACAWITLDRPPLNLFTPSLIAELAATFRSLTLDESVRVTVITGDGKHMTGGMQLEELRDLTAESGNTAHLRALGGGRSRACGTLSNNRHGERGLPWRRI
jgi:enoyl-CoA hydratase/carnithine racemase